ncbi:beta-glycosidase [Pedobacter polaris]|uniref:Beta-glycosidase n=1 Tax=Pedobacter polaris TaxID=2571273 RepID=A0A4U1CI59_9SPHI|nr:glycoside hydrolase [Pedobacter polaris]TKC06578.1 beta-glycosidase [Pedobacter polaris]
MYRAIILVVLLNLYCTNIKAQQSNPVVKLKLDLTKSAQVIENFGSSGCWYSESVGNFWPSDKKNKIAELLFSQKINDNGSLAGIGLSAWRFNVGAGTLEQGNNSGIKDFNRRTDSFLNPDGTYDWNKQVGQRFFLQKAKDYDVGTLIAFSNSPPVQFTKNGLGFKTEKDFTTNLRDDSYEDYAKFLTNVMKHFDQQKIHFNYISPVNEPQWDWSRKPGEADQEGTPWTNKEIFEVAKTLNNALEKEKLTGKILVPEAAMLNYLYAGSGKATRQIQSFFDVKSALYIGNLSHVPKIIAGHSYFTESNNKVLLETRKQLADTIKKYKLNFWQSEYSMLADGFREGQQGDRSPMDCALFLAKVIHSDLTVGNATAWQFWNAYEPGSAKRNTRYYLIALQPKPDFKNGEFTVTKNLWALGHYSRFVRPGMRRVLTETIAEKESEAQKDLLVSAFKNENNQLVLVVINYGKIDIDVELAIKNAKRNYTTTTTYTTSAEEKVDMRLQSKKKSSDVMKIQARSIQTILVD